MRILGRDSGFTIVEVMVAATILLTGALGTLAMMDMATKKTRKSSDRQKATSVAREVVEAAKSVPYRQIEPDTVVDRLREDASIAGTGPSPWRIVRDGTTFTINADVCWLDEPADGLGSRAEGGFCDGAGSGGTADTNPVDYKRVTITASWANGSGRGNVRQSTLVTVRGVDAPSVTSLRMTSPAASPITNVATTSASFAVTMSSNAETMIWSLDGVQRGGGIGSGKNWMFTWQLPIHDGAYDVSAQGFESGGLSGAGRSLTVVLNRFAPYAPPNFNAGRNGTGSSAVVEAEWTALKERDIIGYRVYRRPLNDNKQTVLVCPLTSQTSCVDTSPPTSQGGRLDYWVVGVDRDPSGALREGALSAAVDVNTGNRAPNAPTNFTLSKNAEGDTVLRWAHPNPGDPDTGDYIDSYRIYRDGTAIGNRYDRLGGNETMTVDSAHGGTTHQYWITAVDRTLRESTMVGPVSG